MLADILYCIQLVIMLCTHKEMCSWGMSLKNEKEKKIASVWLGAR